MEIEKYLKSILSGTPEKKTFFRLYGWVCVVMCSIKKYCKYVCINDFGNVWLYFKLKF
jgi:hypothetical protein